MVGRVSCNMLAILLTLLPCDRHSGRHINASSIIPHHACKMQSSPHSNYHQREGFSHSYQYQKRTCKRKSLDYILMNCRIMPKEHLYFVNVSFSRKAMQSDFFCFKCACVCSFQSKVFCHCTAFISMR